MAEPWMKWAVAEGGAKTANRVVSKFVGQAAGTTTGSVFATTLIGLVQMIGGLAGSSARGQPLWPGRNLIVASVIFGSFATLMTILGIVSFTYLDADVGITTFIITLSIIPGALIDWAFFNHPLSARQCFLGIPMFLLSGWAILNFPNLETLLVLPMWVILTLGITISSAINEGISQYQAQSRKRRRAASSMDPLVNNFWVGLTTLTLGSLIFVILGNWGEVSALSRRFWISTIVIGAIVVGMISFKLIAYKGGGSIALKKVIMQGTYLVTATFLGVLVHGEPLTTGKLVGLFGYFIAFTLMDNEIWKFIRQKFFNPTIIQT